METQFAHLQLAVLEAEYKYVTFGSHSDLAEAFKCMSDQEGLVWSIFKTQTEISALIPACIQVSSSKEESGWHPFTIVGAMPFGTVQGLIAKISGSLRDIGVGVCIISTFETDIFLVRKTKLGEVRKKLEADGWEFIS